uniref:SUN domain-containing protein n=1 Tax=Caenorhabditis tropicalis TaxID=1561998 RepID=A0A1I7UD93_9PELO
MTLTNADIESAYGSDGASISNETLKKETFSIQESTKKENKWSQYRQYGQIIGMGIVSFILILLLINSYRLTSNVEEIRLIVSNLQIQFDKLPKSSVRENSKFEKSELIDKENEEMMERLSEALKELKPIVMNEEVKNEETSIENPLHTINSQAVKEVKLISLNKENRNQENEIEEIPIKNSLHTFNSASYMFGATVDTSYSSSSDLSGESDLVLLDRPNPPANRAWCSDENEPVLTVNLANYIKPTAVSYQHFKWNRTVTHGSPRVFDVFTCLDFNCNKTEPLISNCEYKSSGGIQEQIYHIPSISKTKSIGKVQFRFMKNHGNVKKTCVSLVRVYGESTELPKMREYKEL